MRHSDKRFAEAVQAVLDEHGATLRSQRQRTGLAHSTILNWLQGVKPQMEAVIAFARGFGLSVNEWLELAGYEPIELDLPAFEKQMMREFGSSPAAREIIRSHLARLAEVARAGEGEPQRVATAEEEIRDEILYRQAQSLETIRAASRTLTYDEDLEGVTVAGYRGSEVPPEDAEALNQLYRAFLTEQRRRQGRA